MYYRSMHYATLSHGAISPLIVLHHFNENAIFISSYSQGFHDAFGMQLNLQPHPPTPSPMKRGRKERGSFNTELKFLKKAV